MKKLTFTEETQTSFTSLGVKTAINRDHDPDIIIGVTGIRRQLDEIMPHKSGAEPDDFQADLKSGKKKKHGKKKKKAKNKKDDEWIFDSPHHSSPHHEGSPFYGRYR